MDREEYKIKLEEIHRRAGEGDFKGAQAVVDTIDWRQVKSSRTLCMVAEIYEANKRFEDSERVLKIAYRRAPANKTVLYRLSEINVRTKDFAESQKYLDEFVKNYPNDSSRFILQYKQSRGKGEPIEAQIDALLAYKEKEYTERWAYELARLYKKAGQREKCVEECDELILWFSEGRYVTKAMELKMTLTPLSAEQQEKYNSRYRVLETPPIPAPMERTLGDSTLPEETGELPHVEETEELSEEELRRREALADAADTRSGQMGRSAMQAAIEKMNAAADKTVSEQNAEEKAPNVTPGLQGMRLPNNEKMQNALVDSIRSVFAGMNQAGQTQELYPNSSFEEELKAWQAANAADNENTAEDAAESPVYSIHEDVAEETPEDVAAAMTEDLPEDADTEQDVADTAEENKDDWLQVSLNLGEEENPFEAPYIAEPGHTQELPTDEELLKAQTQEMPDEDELTALFAETGATFAEEIAGGEHVPIEHTEDSLTQLVLKYAEEDHGEPEEKNVDIRFIEEAEPEPEEETSAEAEEEIAEEEVIEEEVEPELSEEEVRAKAKKDLFDKETDETLGLTREFNFGEELKKAVAAGATVSDAANALYDRAEAEVGEVPVTEFDYSHMPDPEEAARKAVLSAGTQEDLSQEEAVEEVEEELPVEETPAEEAAAEETADVMASDTKEFEGLTPEMEAELLATEEETQPQEDAEEEATDALKDLDVLTAEGPSERVEPDVDIVEQIMEEPETFEALPIEPRRLDDTELRLLSYFAKVPGVGEQVTMAVTDAHNHAGDRTSKAGNMLVIGRQESGKTRLADGLIMAICRDLDITATKVAKVIGRDFNGKDPAAVVKKLAGGFLLIEGAGELDAPTVEKLSRAMEFRTDDLIVILEDEKHDLYAMLEKYPDFAKKFTSTLAVPVFTNDELVTFARTYAKENGYKLDEMGTLALYTMIGENQKNDEPVTVGMVKDMMDHAIAKASSRKFARRFSKNGVDASGRILLREKDFNF